jgi:hypothetical protein
MTTQHLSDSCVRNGLDINFPEEVVNIHSPFVFRGHCFAFGTSSWRRSTSFVLNHLEVSSEGVQVVPTEMESQFLDAIKEEFASKILKVLFMERLGLQSYSFGTLGVPISEWASLPEEVKDSHQWWDEFDSRKFKFPPTIAFMRSFLGL